MSNDERPYRFDSEYRAEVKAAGTDVLRLAQIEEHWLTKAELQSRIEGLKVKLRAQDKQEEKSLGGLANTAGYPNRRNLAHGECSTCPACLEAARVAFLEAAELPKVRERLTATERARSELGNALATRNAELAEAERKHAAVRAARDEALAALERFSSRDTRLDLTPVDPDGPPSRRGLQLAVAIMVWVLGLALLAAHFAAGGAF